jgi:predicted nucleic acid-binding protein
MAMMGVANVQVFRTQFRVLDNTVLVLDNLMALISAIPVAGKQVHDANIVATMRTYGIPHLLTHNTADFARFAHLITAVPLEATA